MTPRSLKGLNFSPYGAVTPSPVNWRDHVLYHLMIDRFDDNRDRPPDESDSANRHDWKPEQGRATSVCPHAQLGPDSQQQRPTAATRRNHDPRCL